MPSFVGAIDQGTSSSRFLVFDHDGKVITYHQEEFEQHYPHAGWVEHDPMVILQSVLTCVEETCKKMKAMGLNPEDIKGVGITNQRETTLVWDSETGKPLHNAIVWSDTRTKETVKKIIDSHPDKHSDCFRAICGLPVSTYFSAVKVKWLMHKIPAVKAASEAGTLRIGTVDTWLIYNLTGGANGGLFITDVTNASRTMFMDINTLEWSDELCETFGVSKSFLPKIVSSSEVYGNITVGALQGVPISGCLGDQQAALVGQKCFNIGDVKNTYGTGCFMLMNTGNEAIQSTSGLLTTVAYKLGKDAKPYYALEGSIAVAGAAVRWLRDNLGLISGSHELDELAAQVEDNGGVYFVTAFSGLFAPYWRSDARGAILGLTQYANKHHLARATYESTCFQTYAILNAMRKDSGKEINVIKADGGLSKSQLCMQFQSDIAGVRVERPEMKETTALGAAFAAGLAVGYWSETSELMGINNEHIYSFSPSMDTTIRDKQINDWERAVERSSGWLPREDSSSEDSD
ncbi:glycerol kinase [Basidiobolus meristosporus CBS 931.73]|uniref:Probable glycerol kinase n=1 Tax=Basidiobolus meristosporus CBS 931.73 TaxID=1314790 RepID=A0A1Y1Y4N3_9FUNG|nr:glycerol kinase [Basidiobolus meristosporus CBS 931.73]|eukprot:ORX92686.1 glycerol kinase [Basidiobolus meristosporus CBS 931.73]